ncbi:MAG: sigma-70 family RNA polymerase sigma factor [Bacteroidota bacterium]
MAFRINTPKAKQVNREEKISDEILIGRIAALDEAAFTEIYQRYANRMLRFFYRMLRQDQEEAQDFAQDLFLKVIEKSDSFNPRHKFSTWLYTLASNMVKNEYRKRSIRDRYKQESKWKAAGFDPEMEKLLDLQNFNTELLKALEFISPEQKGAIVLRYQEGLSLKEISEISNCAVGTVKSRLYYGLHNLSEKLAKYRSEE